MKFTCTECIRFGKDSPNVSVGGLGSDFYEVVDASIDEIRIPVGDFMQRLNYKFFYTDVPWHFE